MPKRTIRILLEFSIPLIAGVVGAVVWANVDLPSYEAFLHFSPLGQGSHYDLHFFVNDMFMAFFFGIAAKEITEACLPGGALNPLSKAINPLLGTLGGVVGPIVVYLLWVWGSEDGTILNGWGVPTATDIALAWLVARMAFGKGHPAVSFLLLLAVADDGIGLAIIAIFYPDPSHPVAPVFLPLVAAAMGIAYVMRRRGVRSFWPYLLLPGALSWLGLFWGHLHPALALVPVVPFMPGADHDEGLFIEVFEEYPKDALNRFEHFFKYPVDAGLLLFGLTNAGVVAASVGNATWGVLAALLLGKTFGIFGASALGDRLGFALPEGMGRRELLVAAMTAGLGLTIALFVAGVAFTDPVVQGAAKMGALMSAGVAPMVLLAAWLLRVRAESRVSMNQ